MSAGKAKGTRWETAVVTFLRANGFPWADRVPLSGARDRGDVVIGPSSPVMELKNQQRHSWAEWLDEAETEATNANAPFGVVWAHRRGRGSPSEGYVVMSGSTFVQLLREAGYGGTP